jgi:hypothetical protein
MALHRSRATTLTETMEVLQQHNNPPIVNEDRRKKYTEAPGQREAKCHRPGSEPEYFYSR